MGYTIGIWPPDDLEPESVDPAAARVLSEIGYDTEDLAAATLAFQRHFCPDALDGVAEGPTLSQLARVRALI